MALLDKLHELLALKAAGHESTATTEDRPGRLTDGQDPHERYADLDAIRARINKVLDEGSRGRAQFERNWFRSILYYLGNQWLTWDQRGNRYREKKLVRKWVPKPVTNVYACLDADTRIPCLDGSVPTIKELADADARPWLFGFDLESYRVIPVQADRVWKTGERDCVRVEFDEGTSVVCTPDHRFLTWKRGYVQAQDLQPGESIIPCLRGVTRLGSNRTPYMTVVQPAEAQSESVHRMVAAHLYGIPPRYHVHHLNDNQLDNRPENLQVLSPSAHSSLTQLQRYARGEKFGTKSPLHAGKMLRLWNDPAYRAKQIKSRRLAWEKTPERRAKVADEIAKRRDPATGKLINHRVKSVTHVGTREVYDISTPATHNFGLEAGVFVHNSTLDSIAGALQSFIVKPSIWPGTIDHDDLATAEVADLVIPVIEEEVRMEHVREDVGSWVTLNADAFAFAYYDLADRSLGTRLIQDHRCLLCQNTASPSEFEESGTCPACGMPANTEPAVDEQGQPVGQDYPIGRLRVDVCSPLELYLEQSLPDIHEHTRFTRQKTYPLDVVKQAFPETGKHVQPDKGTKRKTGQFFLEALAFTSEDGGSFHGSGTGETVTLYTHVELPSDAYPEGLVVTMASDDTVLEAGPSPFFDLVDGKKSYYSSLVQFSYRRVPGRLYAKTPGYDLMPKQDQLNRLESLIEMAIMKGVYTSWILPAGSSVANLSGEPGQLVRYTPTGSSGAKPEVVTHPPFPPLLLQWYEQILKMFEELGGTFDAMKGNVPSGVSAGYAIQLLTERSYGRFGPVFANMERGYIELYRILIRLARQYFTEDRIRRIRGESGQWQIQKFSKADLSSALDVRVEGGSQKPRSKLSEQALVESMSKIGAVNPTDPKQQFMILEMFGMAHVLGGVDVDRRQAAKEWDAFLHWDMATAQMDPATGVPIGGPVVKAVVDNHLVHIMSHQQSAKTDQFDALEHDKQLIWQQHIQDHMMAMAPPQPEPGEPGSGAAPPPKGPGGPAGSKANEMGDPTMATLKGGGTTTMGGDGT